MTNILKTFASGKVVMALEGGYNNQVTADCVCECINVLLGNPVKELVKKNAKINEFMQQIQDIIQIQSKYWKYLPQSTQPITKPPNVSTEDLTKKVKELTIE